MEIRINSNANSASAFYFLSWLANWNMYNDPSRSIKHATSVSGIAAIVNKIE